ncbi:MAG TPA: DNA repair protein RadC [Clostridiaceae bacterium]|jgi:DNA repair protein RadC|nr:DNA repair protein RadC [Clostridiaceae bacterium]
MDHRINQMHVSVRPYERLEQSGESALSDAELLAILIKTGVSGMSSLEVANQVLSLDQAGEGLSFLRDMSLEQLSECKGLGRVKGITIKAAIEIGRRSMAVAPFWKNYQISSPDDALLYFEQRMSQLKREEVHVLLLDTRHRVIRSVIISSGGLASTGVFPRELFREAIKSNASALVLAHNHPSGDPQPSADDIKTTQTLLKTSAMIGIDFVDHLVVGRGRSISMKREGLL